ncbi:uncharacterized protein LOC110112623 [Dendrobium catenatum]|uniref:uncharacterized protein LOC110112623 n=1 Tax=Dendrobium catenatum TaxID=906689 RepID=UPI0009F1735A|nr:uncharacterized protein LOC110112623 [Dendrobium catenatum]
MKLFLERFAKPGPLRDRCNFFLYLMGSSSFVSPLRKIMRWHGLKACGISRIASKIGIPLAVDVLTAQKTRLTFARVCIQVDASATYPEEIPISIEDDVFSLKIQYEWKPTVCEHCKSMVHGSFLCPFKPEAATSNVIQPPQTSFRGRSKSRKPQGRNPPSSPTISPSIIPSSIALAGPSPQAQTGPTMVESTMVQSSLLASSKQTNTQQNPSLPPLPPPPTSSTIPTQIPPTALLPTLVLSISNIPNLNSPHEASSSSNSSSLPPYKPLPPKIQSPNKFDALHLLVEDQDNSANDTSLEIDSSARVKEKEKPQTHSDNDRDARIPLWDKIRSCADTISNPWIIMGDLNCCRFAADKSGGNVLSHSSLGELNSVIFDANIEDLNSVGNKYTWFNQQTSNPIHIKLDRVLVNEQWTSTYPNSYYSVQAPSCSDHCPLILHSTVNIPTPHRFLFKNFWTSLDAYWYILLDVFSANQVGNPLADLCNKLRALKRRLKLEP